MKAPSPERVREVLDAALSRIEAGVSYDGMTYEEGVRDALDFALGNTSEAPELAAPDAEPGPGQHSRRDP